MIKDSPLWAFATYEVLLPPLQKWKRRLTMNDEQITTLDMFQLLREDIKSSEARLLADMQKLGEDIKSSLGTPLGRYAKAVFRIPIGHTRFGGSITKSGGSRRWQKSGDNFSENAHGLALPNCRGSWCRRCDKGVFLIVSDIVAYTDDGNGRDLQTNEKYGHFDTPPALSEVTHHRVGYA